MTHTESNCIFCKIVRGEQPASKVYEDDHFIAFKDIQPKAPVHILVIPKSHIESFDQVSLDQQPYMDQVFAVIQTITADLGVQGAYQLRINTGKQAGQVVFHLHIHIKGGWDQPQLG